MKRYLVNIFLMIVLLGPVGVAQHVPSAQAASEPTSFQVDPPAKPRYTITDLCTLGGDTSQAFGVNNKGHVVGLAKLDSQIYHAFFWDGKTMTDLGTLGGMFSSAYGINDSGVIVGSAQGADGLWYAVQWMPVPEPAGLLCVGPLAMVLIIRMRRRRG